MSRGVLRRLPTNERLSVPQPKRTVLANTRRWGEPILLAHQRLSAALDEKVGTDGCLLAYRSNYSFLHYPQPLRLDPDSAIGLCSAAVLLNWLVGRSLEALPENASLLDAELWFSHGLANSSSLAGELHLHTQNAVLESLRDLDLGPHFIDIFPYAAEVFETSDEIITAFGRSRKSKRSAGVFYTPSDVSEFIVNHTLSSVSKCDSSSVVERSWLDPASGTGGFLQSVLYQMAELVPFNSSGDALSFVASNLFGVDISPLALQSAAYGLALTCMQGEVRREQALQEILHRIGGNLAVCDATTLRSSEDLSRIFPTLRGGADFVVSNPPYAKGSSVASIGQEKLFQNLIPETRKVGNLYPSFVRMLSILSNERHGAGGMVVPLSIAYNNGQEFRALRRFMWTSDGEWRLAHFDRTPDSLFGDDVKTRSTIVFFKRATDSANELYTTDLIRWSSRSRTGLFERMRFTRVPEQFMYGTVPKTGDRFGSEILTLTSSKPLHTLADSITRTSTPMNEAPGRLLRNASTAYNWLPFERVPNLCPNGTLNASVVEPGYHCWTAGSAGDASAVFALVHSRLAYWLWRVHGDGFHLTDRFIKALPLSLNGFSHADRRKLQDLGDNLWIEMLQNKIVSRNAGVVRTSYCPYYSEDVLDRVDCLIVDTLGLPKGTNAYLKEFVHRTIVAGRDSEIDSNAALRSFMRRGET